MADKKLPHNDQKLIGNLTVADAQHLIQTEGGEVSLFERVVQLISIVVVAALTARAIKTGNATVWHLALPMVGQYLALIATLPLIYAVLRHPDLRKDSIGALRLWAGIAVFIAIAILVRSRQDDTTWQEQFAADFAICWKWIADAEMLWPIAIAALSSLLELPGRVRNLYEFGPPFSGVSLGCAMRLVVLFLGCAVLPWAMGSQTRMAWTLWTMILVAELLAVWMHWDIQHQLRKVNSVKGPSVSK